MRLVIQRAAQASVTVDGELVSEIGKGLFILVGGCMYRGNIAQKSRYFYPKTM